MTPVEHGRAVLAQQPFSALMGTELTRLDNGTAELRLVLRGEHMQQHGFAHGGVVSYLADNALTYAGGSVLGDVVTLEMKINYMRPAKGDVLIARAETLSSGRTQAVCHCKVSIVSQGQEKICAAAQGTIAAVGAG